MPLGALSLKVGGGSELLGDELWVAVSEMCHQRAHETQKFTKEMLGEWCGRIGWWKRLRKSGLSGAQAS